MKQFRQRLNHALAGARPTIILDPQDIAGNVVSSESENPATARNWFELRKWWHRVAQALRQDDPPAVLRLTDAQIRLRRDVPPDILAHVNVIEIESGMTDSTALVLGQVPEELAGVIIDSRLSDDEALAKVAEYFDIDMSPRSAAAELANAVALTVRQDMPELIRVSVLKRLNDPMAIELASTGSASGLQEAWTAWLSGKSSPTMTNVITQLGHRITPLFVSGILKPSTATRDVPSWARMGVADRDLEQQLLEKCSALPEDPPATQEDWKRVAEQLGEMRWMVTSGVGEIAAQKFEQRDRILSDAFETWIRDNYGSLFSRTTRYPLVVSRVADFLRRRLNDGKAQKVVLLVLDGVGMSQWAQIKAKAAIEPIEEHQMFAVIPTVTSISRQAIFAGSLPRDFASSIGTTAQECRAWKRFWTYQAGLEEFDVQYLRVEGDKAVESYGIADYTVVGIAAVAIDEFGHSSSVYHDVQQSLLIDEWISRKFLAGVIDEARAAEAELWVTADHGNIRCHGIGPSNPGVLGERATTRVQLFQSASDRSSSSTPGIDWDAASTLPPDKFPRFASGTDAYTISGRVILTHGGLSIHEVIVPLARLV